MSYKLKPTTEELIPKVAIALIRARELWLEKMMVKILPPGLFKLASSKKPLHREMIQRYMAEHQIRVEEHPDRTEMLVGDKVMGQLVVSFEDGKVKVIARTAEDTPRRQTRGIRMISYCKPFAISL